LKSIVIARFASVLDNDEKDRIGQRQRQHFRPENVGLFYEINGSFDQALKIDGHNN
jgi:hypothetical protein